MVLAKNTECIPHPCCLKVPGELQLKGARGSEGGGKEAASVNFLGCGGCGSSGVCTGLCQPSPGPGRGGAGRRRSGCPLLPAALGCRALRGRCGGRSEGALREPQAGVWLAGLSCWSSVSPVAGGRWGAGRVQVSTAMLGSLCRAREAGMSGSRRSGAPDPTLQGGCSTALTGAPTPGAGAVTRCWSFNTGF